MKHLWEDFPLYNFVLYAVCIAHAEIVSLEPQRLDLVPTFIFPLLVPVVVFALRRAWRQLAALAVVPALILLLWLSGLRAPLEAGTLRLIYEFAVLAQTGLLLWHAHSTRPGLLRLLLGPALLYGIVLENGGIFLGYFHELSYLLYLGPLPAPVATMTAWVGVIYIVLWTTWQLRELVPRLRRSPALSALVAAAAGVLLDLQIDPLATAVGFWSWHPWLPQGPWGVPLLNFVAWACALWPFAWWTFQRQAQLGLTPAELGERPHQTWLWQRLPLTLGTASVAFLGTMALLEQSLSGPTFRILLHTAVRLGLFAPDQIWTPGS